MKTESKNEMIVARHAEMASTILASLHELTVSGKVDLTNGEAWDYDWPLLEELLRLVPSMETVSTCHADTSYFGTWTRREVQLDLHLYGTDYRGTLSVSRTGPGLDEVHWSFRETTEAVAA